MNRMMRPSLLLICFSLAACKPAPAPVVNIDPPAVILPASVKELTPEEASTWLTQTPEAVALDLRMPEEIDREGRITGSRHYDFLQARTQEQIKELDAKKPYLLYCALGGRARRMAMTMHGMGFKQISILKGGMEAWKKDGKPAIK